MFRRAKEFVLVATLAAGTRLQGEITVLSVTSAASFEPGLPPKGSIGTIFCKGLRGVDAVVSASTVPLPFELAGIRVSVAGAPAPLFAIARGDGFEQINFQVPQEGPVFEISDDPIEVRVVQGAEGASLQTRLRWRSPGDIFRYGDNLGIFQHASDYSLVTKENPARPGEVIVAYLTGMERPVPVVASGNPSPSDPPAVVPLRTDGDYTDRYSLAITYVRPSSGLPLILDLAPAFMGLAPGLVGVYQVNVRIPEDGIYGPGVPTPTLVQARLTRRVCLGKLPPILSGCNSPNANRSGDPVRIFVVDK